MRSTVVGGEGYNELSFENKAGSEEIFLHAQRFKLEIIGQSSELIHVEGTKQIDMLQSAFTTTALLASCLFPPISMIAGLTVLVTANLSTERLKKMASS